MSIEFPWFAMFAGLPKGRKPVKPEEEASIGSETGDQAQENSSAAPAQRPTRAKHEAKPFRVKGGSRRRRKRKA